MGNVDVKPFTSSHRAMGTIFEIVIFSDKGEFFLRSLTERLFAELDRYERSMSLFVDDSDVNSINENSGKRPVRVSLEVFELIKTAVYYSKLTGGYFDITIGPLMGLWGFYGKREAAPSDKEIEEVLGKIGYKNIVLNDEDGSVFLKNAGMIIDLGGIAKGWSLKALIKSLKKFGIENFLINAGRSSVYASGCPQAGEFWEAELPVIKDGASTAEKVLLKNSSVAISGSFEHFVTYGKKQYSHIINPLTGRPDSNIVLTTVINSDPLDCEILSTAFSAMGVRKTGSFLEKNAAEKSYNVMLVFYGDDGNLGKATFNYKS